MQDPCGRLPAPDSYAGSAAPSITGFGGHPTRFSRSQGVARDMDDSYAESSAQMTFLGLVLRGSAGEWMFG
jgi:hypothetical protein